MISVTITRNHNGQVCGFTVEHHGVGEVCAAVSMLALNTVNSIEALTKEPYACDYNDAGGFLSCTLPKMAEGGRKSRDAGLLLESMALGMHSIKEHYPGEIKLADLTLTESAAPNGKKANAKAVSKGSAAKDLKPDAK